MLHIILTVLKITGLVILSIIGLILLLLILVLAAPISYEAKAGYDADVSVFARVRLLYRILGVRFRLEEKKTKLEILLFGHVLGGSKKKEKEQEEETSSDDFEFDLASDDSEGFSDQSETIEEISVDYHVEDSVENDSEVTVTEPDEFISEEVSDGEAMEDGSEVHDPSDFSDDSDASYEFSDEGMPEDEGEGKKKAGAMDYVRRIWDFLNRDSVQKLESL